MIVKSRLRTDPRNQEILPEPYEALSYIISSSGTRQMLYADEIQYAQSDAHYYDLHLKDGTVIKVRMTQKEIRNTLGDSFLLVSRGWSSTWNSSASLAPNPACLGMGGKSS